MKLWLLLKKHNRLLTKLTSVLCACWKKLAASNSPSGLLSSRPIFWVGFFIARHLLQAIKNPSMRAASTGSFQALLQWVQRCTRDHRSSSARYADFHRQAIFSRDNITHHIPVHAQVVGDVFTLEHGV